MKLSFRLKLALTIALLVVVLSSLGMWVVYRATYATTLERMAKNLIDVGRLATVVLDEECHAAIKRLTAATEEARLLSPDEILEIPKTGVTSSLSSQTVGRLQANDDFQLLVQHLEMIAISSLQEMPLQTETFDAEHLFNYFEQGMIAPYLMTAVSGVQLTSVFQYLVTPGYAPTRSGWPGNPIGNLQYSLLPVNDLFTGRATCLGQLVNDGFYVSMSAAVPIIDSEGQLIAALGLDYPAGQELAKLEHLRYLSYGVITVSTMLGLLLSWLFSHRLTQALGLLHQAALDLSERRYTTRVAIKSADEFGVVAASFNHMADAVCRSIHELRHSNERLRAVTADMHDGVGAVMANIQLQTRPGGNAQVADVHALANQGLGEVRFLMDSLEYDNSDFSMLCEGVELLAAEILTPQQIRWQLDVSGEARTELPFKLYLDLQRIVREALTNCVKHSTADHCSLRLNLQADSLQLEIVDNGTVAAVSRLSSGGRGLENMRYRLQRYGGELIVDHTDAGFSLQCLVVLPSRAQENPLRDPMALDVGAC